MKVNCCDDSGKENQENTKCGGGAVHVRLDPQVETASHPKQLFTEYDANTSYLRCV
jgi:hypothetical protein